MSLSAARIGRELGASTWCVSCRNGPINARESNRFQTELNRFCSSRFDDTLWSSDDDDKEEEEEEIDYFSEDESDDDEEEEQEEQEASTEIPGSSSLAAQSEAAVSHSR